MPQFDKKSLSRLLSQVDRELLVEAHADAELTSLLTTPALDTLKEVAELFNLIANLNTFGFEAVEELLNDIKEDIGPTTLSFLTFALEQFVKLADIGDVGLGVDEKIEKANETLAEIENTVINLRELLSEDPGDPVPKDLPTARALLVSAADDLRFAITVAENPEASRAIIRAREKIESAFALLELIATPTV